MSNDNHTQRGFTLVELSVTLTIIAFLIAAIVYGKSLMRKAEAKAVISEMTEYLTALEHFREKYGYRPGDIPATMANPVAQRFFSGNAIDTDANGNGEWDREDERDILWNQLSQAEMITQRIDVPNADDASVAGVNRPASTIASAGWTIMHEFTVTPPGGGGDITFYNVLRLGRTDQAAMAPGDEFFSIGALELWYHRFIDSKIDIPDTPLAGKYVAGNPCAVASLAYSTDDALLCTANFLETVSVGGFTPP